MPFPSTRTHDPLLDDLNPAQRTAVTYPGCCLLVLAGAGSGKTRMLTRRAAWLVRQGVPPGAVLAVTFTRKAAEELTGRLKELLGPQGKQLFTSTFHAFGAWLLRQAAPLIGRDESFSIFDAEDTRKAVSTILKERHHGEPTTVCETISRLKQYGDTGADEWMTEIYAEYETRLAAANAVDFDDLIRLPVTLLEAHPRFRRSITDRFRHVLVDEYQDLTPLEHRLISALSLAEAEPPGPPAGDAAAGPFLAARTFTAAGDDDQTIMSFRYADTGPLLEFERHFAGGEVIDAAVNYRCSPEILDAAARLISHNQTRRPKALRTSNPPGPRPEILSWVTDREEAHGLAERLRDARETSPGQTIAVLSRIHALLRPPAQACLAAGLPVHVVHETALHERKEVKDILAFCRAALNPDDWAAHQRALVVPPRGVGPKRLARLEAAARGSGVRGALDEAAAKLPALREVLTLLNWLASPGRQPREALRTVIDTIGYREYLTRTLGADGAASRVAHLEDLLAIAHKWETTHGVDLRGFLDALTLAEPNGRGDTTAIQCSTLHAAKGCEWDLVVIIGLEEGMLPHYRQRDGADLEEERRLCYVGMTRARRHLILSHCRERIVWGERRVLAPSRFLDELSADRPRRAADVVPPESARRDVKSGSAVGPGLVSRGLTVPAPPRSAS